MGALPCFYVGGYLRADMESAPTGEARINMEIERKWMVVGWPEGLEQTEVYKMDQGYISVRPTVRIRREALQSTSAVRPPCKASRRMRTVGRTLM